MNHGTQEERAPVLEHDVTSPDQILMLTEEDVQDNIEITMEGYNIVLSPGPTPMIADWNARGLENLLELPIDIRNMATIKGTIIDLNRLALAQTMKCWILETDPPIPLEMISRATTTTDRNHMTNQTYALTTILDALRKKITVNISVIENLVIAHQCLILSLWRCFLCRQSMTTRQLLIEHILNFHVRIKPNGRPLAPHNHNLISKQATPKEWQILIKKVDLRLITQGEIRKHPL